MTEGTTGAETKPSRKTEAVVTLQEGLWTPMIPHFVEVIRKSSNHLQFLA